MKLKLITLALAGFLFTSCQEAPQYVLEVTTFNTKARVDPSVFQKLDAEVENNFTSKQPGFIRRQSGINDQGEYVVLVYWNSIDDAQASMQKFMGDQSVADYAAMIEGATMKMARYTIKDQFNATSSAFVEVMTYKTTGDVDERSLAKMNKKVEAKVTAPKEGFLQRITGSTEDKTQLVVIYWDSKTNSDAALQPFMEHPLSQKFMGMMDQSSITMGRYQTLKSLDN